MHVLNHQKSVAQKSDRKIRFTTSSAMLFDKVHVLRNDESSLRFIQDVFQLVPWKMSGKLIFSESEKIWNCCFKCGEKQTLINCWWLMEIFSFDADINWLSWLSSCWFERYKIDVHDALMLFIKLFYAFLFLVFLRHTELKTWFTEELIRTVNIAPKKTPVALTSLLDLQHLMTT